MANYLHIGKDKYWQVDTMVFPMQPVSTIADVYFSSPEMGHRISVDVQGDNKGLALQELHSRLVLYGMTEVAQLVMTEIEEVE